MVGPISRLFSMVKGVASDHPTATARAKEVVAGTASGAVYGAVSIAIRNSLRSQQNLVAIMYGAAIPGCFAAAVVGGMAGLKIVEKYVGENPPMYAKVLGAALGGGSFFTASFLGAKHFFDNAAPDDLAALQTMLTPFLSNLGATIPSKVVQTFLANVYSHEATRFAEPATTTGLTQAGRDGLQAVRCLLDSLPRMSLVGLGNATNTFGHAVGSHTALGFLGSGVGILWDLLRGAQFGQAGHHLDAAFLTTNRTVEADQAATLLRKILVSAGAAWGASSIAPALNDAGGVPSYFRPFVFAAIGCLIGLVYTEQARGATLNTIIRHAGTRGGQDNAIENNAVALDVIQGNAGENNALERNAGENHA